jgi:hypothetical protein
MCGAEGQRTANEPPRGALLVIDEKITGSASAQRVCREGTG